MVKSSVIKLQDRDTEETGIDSEIFSGIGEYNFDDQGETDICDYEYSGIEARELLLKLFPGRKLVLSQLTFFNQSGVSIPSGEEFRRGRRCYKLVDLLPIACVLALKEQGIALKLISHIPDTIRKNMQEIFSFSKTCKIVGCGDEVALGVEDDGVEEEFLSRFLSGELPQKLFWVYDLSSTAEQLIRVAADEEISSDKDIVLPSETAEDKEIDYTLSNGERICISSEENTSIESSNLVVDLDKKKHAA